MPADFQDGRHSFFAGGFGSTVNVVANASVAQGSTVLGEGFYTACANGETFICSGSLGCAPTASNGFLLGSGVPFHFAIRPNDGGVVAALAVAGTSLVSITRRQ